MAGTLQAPVETSGGRICYGCGSSYPETVRFCPKDSTDLEYVPQQIENLAQGLGGPKKWVAVSILSALILALAAYVGIERLNSTVSTNNAASGELTVRTTPIGARVYLDGSQVGISPVRLSIPTGVHEVRAVFPGYSDGRAHVEILPSETQKLVWDLSPLPKRRISDRNKYLAELSPKESFPAKKESAQDLI